MSNEWMFEGKVCFRIHDEGSKVYHKDLGNLFKEEFSPRAPATPDYIVVLGNLDEQEKDSDGVIRMPIRGYLAAKRTSRKSWHEWIPQPDFTWTKVTGGMLTFPQFLEDRNIIGAKNGPWYELVYWGRRHFFPIQGRSWAFDGSLTVQPKNPSDCKDFLERARDAFLESAGISDDWPSGIRFLLVVCDITAVADADEAREVEVEVKGFLQTTKSHMSKWETWLECTWRPIRGGLGGNKEFEDAEAAVRSDVSVWIELLRKGALGRNNARRIADAKMVANFALFEANASFLTTHSRNSPSPLQAHAAAAKATSSSSSSSIPN
jgi:hypothetical protein